MEDSNILETSPLVEGLLMIHRIITRGLSTSIRKCDEYIGKQGISPEELKGFSMYVSALRRVTNAHHLTEDEIAYPYFKDNIKAPYDRLTDDHHTIAYILVEIEKCLPGISSGGLDKLREVLYKFEKQWGPHIRIEEDNFTVEKVQVIAGQKEQKELADKIGKHSSKNSGPAPLTVPFLIYNLEEKDRETFMMNFPWIVKKVIVPVIWKNQWKPMSPFLLM